MQDMGHFLGRTAHLCCSKQMNLKRDIIEVNLKLLYHHARYRCAKG